MSEEKRRNLALSEIIQDIIAEIILLAIAFILFAYGINGIPQGSILGSLSVTLGIVCVGLSCIGPNGLKHYLQENS